MASISSAFPPLVEGTLCSHMGTIYEPGVFEYPLPRSTLETYLDGKALGHQQSYSAEARVCLEQDIDALFQAILNKNPPKGRTITITVGPPGSGKTELARKDLKRLGPDIVYIDLNDVCLSGMWQTYQEELAQAREGLDRLGFKSRQAKIDAEYWKRQDLYIKWRSGAEAAGHLLLAHFIRGCYKIYLESNFAEPTEATLFEFLKKRGYHIRLLHVTTPEEIRSKSIEERDRYFAHTTDTDICKKARLFPHSLKDTYLKYADEIEFYYRCGWCEEACLAAIWTKTWHNKREGNTLCKWNERKFRVIHPEAYQYIQTLHPINLWPFELLDPATLGKKEITIQSLLTYESSPKPPASLPLNHPILTPLNPPEWKYVSLNPDRIDALALKLIQKNSLKTPDWSETLPPGLEMYERIEYIMGLICIDFCHWDFKQDPNESGIRQFYTTDDRGVKVRGSLAMTTLIKRAYAKGLRIFDPIFMASMTVEDLSPYFMGVDEKGDPMEIPWLESRVKVLNEVGAVLFDRWDGSFCHLFNTAKTRAFNEGCGFVELLVRDFPRFQDEYFYQDKNIKIYKLAQLSVMALQSALRPCKDFFPFTDCDTLTLCADYQLPRSLRAWGVLKYSPELTTVIDEEKLIAPGSPFEIELRMATLFAGEELKKAINARLAEKKLPPITAQELDYALWSHGRVLSSISNKHHLTLTTMY